MKKILTLILAVVVLAMAFTGCGTKSDTLNLYTWEGMFPQEVLDAFTTETGIKINYVNFDTSETMLTKLDAAKGGDYDVIVADDYILESVIAQGLAQKLDKTKITNMKNVNTSVQNLFYDPSSSYTVPYGAGLQTIVYDPSKVSTKITGYIDLWNTEFEDRIGLITNPRVINGMALKVLEQSYNTEDLDIIKKAGEKLLELAPNVRVNKDDNLQDDLLSGEVDIAVMYSSQVTLAKLANAELEIVFPKEGLGFGTMPMFIPTKAPNSDAAHKFIDFIFRPEISKQCFEYIGYYSTNVEADKLISPELKDLIAMPTNLDGAESIRVFEGEANDLHNTIYTEFKNACG